MTDHLSEPEISRIEEHMRTHTMTLALVRTGLAPGELGPLLDAIEGRLRASLSRTYSSPMSEFCIAEMGSGGKVLVLLFVEGKRTELMSVSETDEVAVKDLEDSIHYSNFYSEIMRHGL